VESFLKGLIQGCATHEPTLNIWRIDCRDLSPLAKTDAYVGLLPVDALLSKVYDLFTMPRSLKVVFTFGGFLLVLIALGDIKRDYPLRSFISGAVEHLLIVVTSVIVGGILLWIIEEAIEQQITPAIRVGLSVMAAQLAQEVHAFPEAWQTMQATRAGLVASIGNAEVRDLVSEGRIGEAAEKTVGPDDQIKVYLQSQSPADWDKAVELAKSLKVPPPKYFVTAAYLYFELGKTGKAIEIGEEGLKYAENAGNLTYVRRLQNSLAYYYAESMEAKYEQRAREYVISAKINTDASEVLDTEGWVQISYSKTKEEVLAGLRLCLEAVDKGSPISYYERALARASERLKSLS
jgi:hypothetical protein